MNFVDADIRISAHPNVKNYLNFYSFSPSFNIELETGRDFQKREGMGLSNVKTNAVKRMNRICKKHHQIFQSWPRFILNDFVQMVWPV